MSWAAACAAMANGHAMRRASWAPELFILLTGRGLCWMDGTLYRDEFPINNEIAADWEFKP